MSSALSSTSSNTADHCTAVSCWAPTAESVSDPTEVNRSDGVAFFGDIGGTRTSNPADVRIGPMLVIRSQASSWLRMTWPRRLSLPRCSGSYRPSRRSSSCLIVSLRLCLARDIAASTGSSFRRPSLASVRSSHASPESGGSSWTISCSREVPVTFLAHVCRPLETSAPYDAGASNVEPFSRPRTASATSDALRGWGGGAGTSTRPAASRQIASTKPSTMLRVTARGSFCFSRTATPVGRDRTRWVSSSWSISAGSQRTANDMRLFPPFLFLPLPLPPLSSDSFCSCGTMRPSATRRTASAAARPIHVTLAPRLSSSAVEPSETSHPSVVCTGADTAGACAPNGSGTGSWASKVSVPVPASRSRWSTASSSSGSAFSAAAQATMRPSCQDSCSWGVPVSGAGGAGSSGAAASGVESVAVAAAGAWARVWSRRFAGGGGSTPVTSVSISSIRSRSSSKSSSTSSRSGPRNSPRKRSIVTSTARRRSSSARTHSSSCASRKATSASDAMPSRCSCASSRNCSGVAARSRVVGGMVRPFWVSPGAGAPCRRAPGRHVMPTWHRQIGLPTSRPGV